MTTYLLLALTDDGRVTATPSVEPFAHPHQYCACDRRAVIAQPVRSGDDRGQFATYEVAGYSIDVMKLPEVRS